MRDQTTSTDTKCIPAPPFPSPIIWSALDTDISGDQESFLSCILFCCLLAMATTAEAYQRPMSVQQAMIVSSQDGNTKPRASGSSHGDAAIPLDLATSEMQPRGSNGDNDSSSSGHGCQAAATVALEQ